MATIIKGILGGDLDWQFVMVGVFIAIVLELCNIKAVSFAVGTYLPLATTLPIFIGELISHGLGNDLYMVLGVGFFAAMAFILWRVATRKNKTI